MQISVTEEEQLLEDSMLQIKCKAGYVSKRTAEWRPIDACTFRPTGAATLTQDMITYQSPGLSHSNPLLTSPVIC
jgi:hypothetical protein